MSEDAWQSGGIFDGGDDLHGAAVLGTRFNIDIDPPLGQPAPADWGRRRGKRRVTGISCPARSNDLGTRPAVEREHAVEAKEMGLGTGDDRRQPLHETHSDMTRSVVPSW